MYLSVIVYGVMEQAAISLIDDTEKASVLLNRLRLELLKDLREPASAAELARRLQMPRQKINYHLRELEKQGFVELVEERRRGNCIERVVRSTSRTIALSPEVLGGLATDPLDISDRFSSSYLVATASRVLEDLALLRVRADRARKRLPTLTLDGRIRFSDAAAQAGFAEDLSKALAALVAKYHDETKPGGRTFNFFVGAYPAPAKKGGVKPEDELHESR